MRTTVRLNSAFLKRAKREAERRHVTFTALVEEALRRMLSSGEHTVQRPPATLPVSNMSGGTLPGIDLNDSSALLEAMDARP
jgi:hypothetical protein